MKDKMKAIKGKGFLTGVVVTIVLSLFVQAKTVDSFFEISKNLDLFISLFKEINTYYVDPIEPGKMVKVGVDAMLQTLDPYTNYITESDIEDFEFQTTGKYGGIGAAMRKKEEDIFVGDIYEGSPAQKSGLHSGDQIIAIDKANISGKSIDDISLLLKGAPGTQVVLKVKDAFTSQVSDKTITRAEIDISSVPFFGLVGKSNDIGFVKLTQFTMGCGRQVRMAVDSLKRAQPLLKGIILDLRSNPGGLLDEAVAICNIFIEKGQVVVATKGKLPEMDKEYKTLGQPLDTKIPVAVLVNHSSASASEIVAGTLQDLDRGVVIGERSYGKGLVQMTRNLGYNARLKLTTAKYYTPSGRCIQAIDYTNRNPDGSVGKIPDSLKKVFYTKAGRKVMSGGGVEPDVNIEDEMVSKLAIALYSKDFIFDYATNYVKQHNKIPLASAFSLTDTEFQEFSKWLEGKDFAYKTESEIALDSLKSRAEKEKYYENIKYEITQLQSKLAHNKQQDLVKNKTEIKKYLENEIVSRYYFLRGRIEQSFAYDKELASAINLINQPSEMKAIFQVKK